jgi:hypothetical protein
MPAVPDGPCLLPCRFHVLEHCGGSLTCLLWRVWDGGVVYLWHAIPSPSLMALQYIAVFGGVQAALQLLLPGKTFYGPATPMGNTPVYKVRPGACGAALAAAGAALAAAGAESGSACYGGVASVPSAGTLGAKKRHTRDACRRPMCMLHPVCCMRVARWRARG